MQKILGIYLSGIVVLIGAIIINLFIKLLKISTWYDFINEISRQGLKQVFINQGLFGFIFLFIVYPLLLGLLVYLIVKILNLI